MNKKTMFAWIMGSVLAGIMVAGGFDLVFPDGWSKHGTVFSVNLEEGGSLTLSEPATLQAVGGEYFLVQAETVGELFGVVSDEKPLGWVQDSFYKSQKLMSLATRWEVITGDPTVQVTSEKPVMVSIEYGDVTKRFSLFFSVLMGFTAWLLVIGGGATHWILSGLRQNAE